MRHSNTTCVFAFDASKRRFIRIAACGAFALLVRPAAVDAGMVPDGKDIHEGVELVKAAPALILDYANLIQSLAQDLLLFAPRTAAQFCHSVSSAEFWHRDVNGTRPSDPEGFHHSFDPFVATKQVIRPTRSGIPKVMFALQKKPTAGGKDVIEKAKTDISPAEARSMIQTAQQQGRRQLFDGMRTQVTPPDVERFSRLANTMKDDKEMSAMISKADLRYVRRLVSNDDMIGYGLVERANTQRHYFLSVGEDHSTVSTRRLMRAQLGLA